jgi:outer membrane protein
MNLTRLEGILRSPMARERRFNRGTYIVNETLPWVRSGSRARRLTRLRVLGTWALMNLRSSTALASFFLGCLLFARGASADMRVAVIDVQRAVLQTEDGLRAQATLKKFFDSRQQELNRKQTELQKQKDEIEKQAKTLPKAALQQRVDDWQKQMAELQQVFAEYNKELDKKQKEMTDPIFEKIMGIVKRLASSENFDLVMDKQTVAFVRTDLDLTDRCIQIYNSGGVASGAAPLAPAPAAAPKAPPPAPATKP